MSTLDTLKRAVKAVSGRPRPRILSVDRATHLTPNLIRVTFRGPELDGLPDGCDGGHCKLLLPEPDESRDAFVARIEAGGKPARRTYTVRHYRSADAELDIDFVDHGDGGPASRWARHAKPGSFLGFMGPGAPKLTDFNADWYLVAADLSALPMASAALEAMPRDAKGIAVFEVPSPEDRQTLDAPQGVAVHWLVHADARTASTQQEALLRGLDWPKGRVQTCIAGESGAIKGLRHLLKTERAIPRGDLYLSGYWKVGMVEDQHQTFKRTED